MRIHRLVTTAALLALAPLFAAAQQKEIKIGFIYDVTGPFAGGGSEPAQIGTKAAVDYINERGGVEGYKIVPIFADAQSKADVAINEATRLVDQEKVDIVAGVYSSAQCVPLVQQTDARKKFTWLNVCVATAVFKDKKLTYVFRPTVHSDQYGAASCDYIHYYSKSKFGVEPAKLRVAIIHEDGPYGVGVATGNEAQCKKLGLDIVLKEGYSATAPDLSSLVTKLKRARPDVILHTGYNPDITLFMRQAKEQGLKFKALVGHGAGHSQMEKLRQSFGDDVNYFHSIDPAAAQLLDPKTLKPAMGPLIQELIKRYQAVKGPGELPPHASMGFNNTWILLTDVLPRAIKKYGGIDSESLRKAALDTDIPLGGTMQGYGVKFYGPGTPLAGQNERSFVVVMQYVNGQAKIAWPREIQTVDPVLPFPKGHVFAQ
ncbi:MAG: ABC transporter substrate-binding protein [Betaproteobacteria bacterium]|nr:ABC transporter substrate-binding protein [Betaproteobacteria bacterium]